MDQLISQMDAIPDAVVIKKVLAGEKKLYELIIRRYNQRLFRTGMSILNNDAEVEDAMQVAYISAYEHLGQFENRSSFATWLIKIMINECLVRKNKKKRLNVMAERPPANSINMTTPAQILANKELSAILENAVAQLPEKYRLVFVLREIEDMSVKETAGALDLEESNVKVRLNRAKTMLRDSLGGYMKEQVYSFHLTRCDRITADVMQQLGI